MLKGGAISCIEECSSSLLGDGGEIPFRVCDAEGLFESLTRILVFEALLVNLFIPMPLFRLNSSNQLALVSFKSPLLWFTPVANFWACFVIAASVRERPVL